MEDDKNEDIKMMQAVDSALASIMKLKSMLGGDMESEDFGDTMSEEKE